MIAVRVSDEMPIVVAAAPAYLKQRGTPMEPRELAAHSCLRFWLASGVLYPWRFRMKRRVFELHVEGRLIVNDSSMFISAALEGIGLIQVPLVYIASELAAGRLVTILDDWAPPPRRVLSLLSEPPPYPAGIEGANRFSARGAPQAQ
jgi:DNA-binding transcriptional LysR family regulator